MYRRLRDERRPVVWMVMFGNSAASRRILHYLFNHDKLGIEHDHRRDIHIVGQHWRGRYIWLYTALNIAFIGITFWLIPVKCHPEHIERKLMAGE